ncbi:hypothetical protein BOX15_Mlig007288g2, partial [Macrostomum lignano]
CACLSLKKFKGLRKFFLSNMTSPASGADKESAASLSTGCWHSLPPLQQQHVFPTMAKLDDTLFVIGGCTQTGQPIDSCESIRLGSGDGDIAGSWSAAPSLPTPRAGVQLATLDKRVYAFGGSGPGQSGVATIDALDVESQQWLELGRLPVAVKSCSVASRGGKFFIAGGMETATSTRNEFYCFDPERKKVGNLPPMSVKRYSPGCFLVEESLYLFGGREGRTPVAGCEVFDFRACKWRPLPDLPSHGRVFPIYARTGRRVLCMGGLDPGNLASGFSCLCHSFDLDTEQWSECANLLIGRADAAQCTLDDGRVILAAGFDNTGRPSTSCHLYRPDSDTWTEQSALPSGHMSCAYLAAGARLYLAGGIAEGSLSQAVDYLDLAAV